MLLFSHKQPKSFYSAVWNKHTNLDLTFYLGDVNSLSPHPVHKSGGNFLIPSWNFNKADWGCFKTESATMCDNLPSSDTETNNCYSMFQKKMFNIAKRTNPRDFRKAYIPSWDPKC